jgi:hypothetical protein
LLAPHFSKNGLPTTYFQLLSPIIRPLTVEDES